MADRGASSSEQPVRRKRFYTLAECGPVEGGHGVLLDGRAVRTPLGRPLCVASAVLGEEIANEWQAQGEYLDNRTMPMTRIANTAIDRIGPERDAVAREIAKYASCDLVCYRAEAPSGLIERQNAHWDPIVAWAETETGSRVMLAAGIVAVDQQDQLVEAVMRLARAHDDLTLASLSMATTLTGSALIALALSAGFLDADAAWAAAHVDEDWQIVQWGEDSEAAARRRMMHRDFAAAARVLDLCRA